MCRSDLYCLSIYCTKTVVYCVTLEFYFSPLIFLKNCLMLCCEIFVSYTILAHSSTVVSFSRTP